jgi:hypothetical protein
LKFEKQKTNFEFAVAYKFDSGQVKSPY